MSLSKKTFLKNAKYLSILMSLFTLILLFQNCGQSSFKTITFQHDIEQTSEISPETPYDQPEHDQPEQENSTSLSTDVNWSDNLISAETTSGKIYYVSKTGVDSITYGTATRPFKTIMYGYRKLNPGDTLIVKSGVYSEYIPNYGLLFDKTNATSTKRITIKSEIPGGAIIDLLNKKDSYHVITLLGGYHIIQGFKIRNGFNGGIVIRNGHYNQIVRNEIYNNGNIGDQSNYGHDGIFTGQQTRGTILDGNCVHNNGRKFCRDGTSSPCFLDHGLYLCGDDEVIKNNIVTHNASVGIHIAGYDTVSNMRIYNNVFAFNATGALIWKKFAGIDFKNNIFYKNRNKGLYATNSYGTGITMSNNNFYGSGQIAVAINPVGSISVSQTNVFKVDPLFVSETLGNFRLQNSSTLLNRGLNLYTYVKTDINAKTRPSTGGFDLGVYEQ